MDYNSDFQDKFDNIVNDCSVSDANNNFTRYVYNVIYFNM